MSIRVMSYVWDRSQEREEGLLVLLALADFADDTGLCWPSVPMIATKARITPRAATRILARLEASGEIRRHVGRGRGKRSVYVVVTDKNPTVSPVLLSTGRRNKPDPSGTENPTRGAGKPDPRDTTPLPVRNRHREPSARGLVDKSTDAPLRPLSPAVKRVTDQLLGRPR